MYRFVLFSLWTATRRAFASRLAAISMTTHPQPKEDVCRYAFAEQLFQCRRAHRSVCFPLPRTPCIQSEFWRPFYLELPDSTGIYVFDFRTTNCTNDTNFCGCSFVKFVSFVVAYPSNHACIGQNIENGRVREFQFPVIEVRWSGE